jgi:hypothetical protein
MYFMGALNRSNYTFFQSGYEAVYFKQVRVYTVLATNIADKWSITEKAYDYTLYINHEAFLAKKSQRLLLLLPYLLH